MVMDKRTHYHESANKLWASVELPSETMAKDVANTPCGVAPYIRVRPGAGPSTMITRGRQPVTSEVEKVTCGKCIRQMRRTAGTLRRLIAAEQEKP